MYHYVRPANAPELPGIVPLTAEEFEQQLDWLQEYFDVVGPEDYARATSSKTRSDGPACLLTFDDGTRDHAEVITPILSKRDLSGLFFFLSGPISEGLMPKTHKLHLLLSHITDEELWLNLESALGARELNELTDDTEARRVYYYEQDPLRARIKYIVNFRLDVELGEAILRDSLTRTFGSEEAAARQWFASAEQVVNMREANMVIGSHGHSHRSLANLSEKEIQNEIHRCHEVLTEILGSPPRWHAYPFGGSGSTKSNLDYYDRCLTDLDYKAVFTKDSATWNAESNLSHLDRIDCIHLPPRVSESQAFERIGSFATK